MLKEGDNPKLDQFKGKYTVLYFYPKDNTPGCTKEACSFRDYNEEIEKLGSRVVGVSKDSAESHEKFTDKHKLNFELIADTDLKLHKLFGVWVEKSMFGKKYMGAARTTFLLSPEGEIVKVWQKVKPVGHAKEVYEYLQSINN